VRKIQKSKALDSRPVFLKINAINLSMLLPTSELLRFSITVGTVYNKSCTVYIFFDSGAFY
jgi:hypothetical protein